MTARESTNHSAQPKWQPPLPFKRFQQLYAKGRIDLLVVEEQLSGVAFRSFAPRLHVWQMIVKFALAPGIVIGLGVVVLVLGFDEAMTLLGKKLFMFGAIVALLLWSGVGIRRKRFVYRRCIKDVQHYRRGLKLGLVELEVDPDVKLSSEVRTRVKTTPPPPDPPKKAGASSQKDPSPE